MLKFTSLWSLCSISTHGSSYSATHTSAPLGSTDNHNMADAPGPLCCFKLFAAYACTVHRRNRWNKLLYAESQQMSCTAAEGGAHLLPATQPDLHELDAPLRYLS